MVIGSNISGYVVDMYKVAGGDTHAWRSIWIIPAVMAVCVIIGFVLLFKEPVNSKQNAAV
jgi:MFS family permease